MASQIMREWSIASRHYYALLGALGVIVALGGFAFLQMEHRGHVITGMDNQIVWGLPHVFAVFLIVAASGALNVASVASVFGKSAYKPLAPLSGLLALALLAGGLAVLMLDLGRPDRLIVAMTHFNFKSIFALNVFLYSGFFVIVALYLGFMMDRRLQGRAKSVGVAAFIWRLALTTGTGSIFGFLAAREAYDSALLAPLFVVLSLAYGTALFLLVLLAAERWDRRPPSDTRLAVDALMLERLGRLLAIFVATALYFVAVFHLTKFYTARHDAVTRFIVSDGGIYTALFWLGQVLAGGLIPLAILFQRRLARSRAWVATACLLVVCGGLAQMYVTIVGAQAYPLALFPGMRESSSFFDGEIHPYVPSAWEALLALGGVAVSLSIVAIALRVLRFLPERLDAHTLSRLEGK